MGKDDCSQSTTQLDSHANMVVVGRQATVFGSSGRSANVWPFSNNYSRLQSVPIVDASIAGFSATQERFEVVDFSQGLFPYLQTLIIKRPLKTDISVRYFWLGKKYCILRCSIYHIIIYLKQNTPNLLGYWY